MIHVMPINDERPHDPSPECPCFPVLESREDYREPVCIHNAWDGRESHERSTGKGLLGKGWENVRSGHRE